MKTKLWTALSLALIVAMLVTSFVLASDVDVAVVDVTVPTNSVTLAPGASGNITINMSVTGNQAGTATFEVYRDWTLSGDVFTGSNPQEFTVGSRNGGDPATTFSTSGTVTVAAGQAAGTFTLAVGAFDITNSNATGAKLAAGDPSNYAVTVSAPPPPPSNTAPSVSVVGVADGASYSKGSVPAATCQVTDTEDGNSSFAATLGAITGPYASDGIGSQTATCFYEDAGGLTDGDSATYSIVDPSPPSIGYTLNPASPDGSNGWYKSNVSLTWNVSEPESPNSLQKTDCVDQNITADQAETTYSCSATSAGGPAGPVSVSIKRDATAPSVSLVGGPADGASYYFGSVPAAPTCSASDATAGLAGACSVSGYGATVGSHTVTASASDNAGNSASVSATYTVLAWTISGFYQPVDMNMVNVAKNGSTVPLKFEVFAGSTELTSTSIISTFVQALTCGTGIATDDIENYATGGTSLRYDTTGGQFIFNWQTPKKPGNCYRVTVTTSDGSSIYADFRLK